MSLLYQENGNLIPGIHELSWNEFVNTFGYNKHRMKLIQGLEKAMAELREFGCKAIYIDGSFISKKSNPKDFDACWEPDGIDFNLLSKKYPVLLEFLPNTSKQKALYGGELFPSPQFLLFFQKDRDDLPKGIIKLSL